MVPMQTIFCSSCGELLLNAPACPACGWRRPSATVGSLLWRSETGVRLNRPCMPALIGDVYALPAEAGTIIGIDVPSGKLMWEYALRAGSTTQAIAAHADLLLVSAYDTQPVPQGTQQLQALHPTTGKPVWSVPIASHSVSAPAVDQHTIYVTTSAGLIVALDAQTRRVRWSGPHPAWGPAAPALDAGLVVAGGRGTALRAYRADSGAPLWRFDGPGWFASTPQIQHGRVLAWCWDGQLYALDAASGRLLWQQRGERERGFTSAPLAAGALVLIGSRVHAPDGAADGPRYALLAYQADSGAPLWRYHSSAPISVAPACADNTVLVLNEAGTLAALRLHDGAEQWRASLGRHPVAPPQISAGLVLTAEHAGACAALHRTDAYPPPLSLEAALERGAPDALAVAYALQGAFERAANLFLQLNRPREAAQLFARAGEPLRAGELWEQAGELRRAAELYHSADDWQRLARVLELGGEPLRAAQLYEQHGQPDQAAALYEQAGDRRRAAELYEQSGHHEQAQAILTTLDSWEQQVELYVKFNNLIRAAIILEQHGQLERAAQLYAQANAPREELRLRAQLADWQRAAELALHLNEHVQAAEALSQLGRLLDAAAAHQRAGTAFEHLPDPLRASAQYELALQIYQSLNEDDLSNQCRAVLRRLRGLPELQIIYTTEACCVEDQWSKFQFQIENIGHGPARDITVRIRGMFQIDGDEPIERLAPNQQCVYTLSLLPHKEARGSVAIWVVVSYQDRYQTEYTVQKRLFVSVDRQQVSPISPRSDSDSSIVRLAERLKTYRDTLGILLDRQARLGKAHVDLDVIHTIRDTQQAIRNIKHILRLRGEQVIDEPDDDINC